MALEANAVKDVPSISCLNLPFRHTRRLLGRGLSLSQGLYLYEHTRIYIHTHISQVQCESTISCPRVLRNYMPGHCGRR